MVSIISAISYGIVMFCFGIRYGQRKMRQKIIEAVEESDGFELMDDGSFMLEDGSLTLDDGTFELDDDEYELVSIELERERPEVDSFGIPIFEKKDKKLN